MKTFAIVLVCGLLIGVMGSASAEEKKVPESSFTCSVGEKVCEENGGCMQCTTCCTHIPKNVCKVTCVRTPN